MAMTVLRDKSNDLKAQLEHDCACLMHTSLTGKKKLHIAGTSTDRVAITNR